MNNFPRKFDSFLDAIQAIIMSFLVKLGPFFVALMPALFTAYAIFHTFQDEAGPELALFFAVVVGLAMETVGIVATHTAIYLYNAKEEGVIQPVKFKLMVWLVPIYVIGVATVVGFSEDAFTPLVKAMGIASPFLTCIVYVAVALARDISRVQEKQKDVDDLIREEEIDQKNFDREKELLELRLKYETKLARIEAKKASNNPVNQSQSSVQNGVKNDVFYTINLSREDKKRQVKDNMVDIYLDDPLTGVSTVARQLRISRQTVYNYQEELEKDGKIKRNGHGVEVLQND